MPEVFILTDKSSVINNLKKIHHQVYDLQKGQVNSLLAPEYLDCEIETKKLIIKYPVLSWELNMAGILHGGVISAMIDHSMACTCVAFTGSWCPTTDLSVSFIKSAREGETLHAYGKITDIEDNRLYLECELWNTDGSQLIAAGSAVYLFRKHLF